jgi:hypothetical protein
MDRFKKKEMELLKLQKEIKMQEHKAALKSLIRDEESIQIALRYTQ